MAEQAKKMTKINLVFEVETGSDFQRDCTKELLEIYAKALKISLESRHKKNKVEYALEVIEPLNGKKKTS